MHDLSKWQSKTVLFGERHPPRVLLADRIRWQNLAGHEFNCKRAGADRAPAGGRREAEKLAG